jgi:hypothetical protein
MHQTIKDICKVSKKKRRQRKPQHVRKGKRVRANVPHWLEVGRKHGYPDCCILFFNRVWAPLALATHGIEGKIQRNETCSFDELCLARIYLEHRKYLDGSGYVPCPGCLAKKLGGAETLPTLLSEHPYECCECCKSHIPDEEIDALLRETEVKPVVGASVSVRDDLGEDV